MALCDFSSDRRCPYSLAGWQLAESLDAAALAELKAELKACNFFSISADTSTDEGGIDLPMPHFCARA